MRDIAIRNVYNNAVTIDAGINVYDKDGNNIEIDEMLIEAEISKLRLETTKMLKIAEVTEAYNTANQLPIEYMGTTFQADYKSQDLLAKVLAAGSVPAEFYWLDSTNIKIPMTYEQLQGLVLLLIERNQTNFNNLQMQKADINETTSAQ